MSGKPLSSRQLAFMVFFLLPGSSLVYFAGMAARQDAWLAAGIAVFSGLGMLYVIMQVHSLFPGKNITQICPLVLGKVPGTILNILFFWSLFILTLSLIYDLTSVLKIIYPLFPTLLLIALIILTSSYCLFKGLQSIGILADVSIGVCLFFILLSFILFIPLMDLAKLAPVLENWKPLMAGVIYSADFPFNEVVILALFLPTVHDLASRGRIIYYWYLISALFLVLFDLQLVAVLGPGLAQLYTFPLFELFRLAGFGDFQRLEMLFFLLWFITGLFAILIYFQGLIFVTRDILGLKQDRALILPVGLCLLVFSYVMFPTEIIYLELGFKYTPVYTFPVNVLYPLIVLVAALIYRKRRSGYQSEQEVTPG
ncbi:Spore germination GerAB [Syntrophomonas zehnderi OL-4]|uniref:Spore germination GerAB n=1 Tax=Syntrophomonas zehnderi OL-4 TaxID=690567 RepID=A0A0E4C7Q3_9FIRM|nr:endospore germination permease [Syntrophomonas zehnderi]CFX10257.1 Spore germination GerAB [Syntrophomonas zehnderi OL-4]